MCFRCFFVNSKCVFMCLHWGEDWVWPHCHKTQIDGVLQWCLSLCRFLQSPRMIIELKKSDHQVLRHHSNQNPSPSIAQFGQEVCSRKNPGCFKLLLLRVIEMTCFCEHSMKQNLFSELSCRCVAWHKPVSELYGQFFWPQGLFFALICIISY